MMELSQRKKQNRRLVSTLCTYSTKSGGKSARLLESVITVTRNHALRMDVMTKASPTLDREMVKYH